MLGKKSFLRWAGSKRKTIPQLMQFWNEDHQTYIEPFMGSASLFFALSPPKAILSDINNDLVDTFIAIQNNYELVFKYLSLLNKSKEDYYRIRAIAPSQLDINERAARFIYLNRYCFNGLYRTNLKGQFNVPYSPEKTGTIPSLDKLSEVSENLRNAKIQCCHFSDSLQAAGKDDFVYLDPPYFVNNARVFREYHPKSFEKTDLDFLKLCLRNLSARDVTFVLTYYASEETISFFSEWEILVTQTKRTMSCKVKNRKVVKELIVTNTNINY